jgi:hypothetical protein
MDIAAISGVILAALNAIQALLPLLGVAGNSVSVVTTIIQMLTKLIPFLEQVAPLIGDEATLIYQGVKSILNSLRSDGVVTTAQQDTDLDALDRRVDAAWDKIAPQFDPDAAPDATPT